MIPLLALLTLAADAPSFQLKAASGQSIDLAKLRGQIVLVNFWATHCAPCVKEMPWFSGFAREFRKEKFTVIGISLDEDWKPVKEFLAQQPVDYPVVLGNDAVADDYKVTAMPASFLVDRKGRIVWSHTGLVDRAALREQIRRLL